MNRQNEEYAEPGGNESMNLEPYDGIKILSFKSDFFCRTCLKTGKTIVERMYYEF